MAQLVRVDEKHIRELLLSVSPNRSAQLTALLEDLKPVWWLDRESDEIVFWSRRGDPNEICMGLRSSMRLQAHSYAAAVIFSAIGESKSEQERTLAPVEKLLNWAVGVDLTRWARDIGIYLPAEHVLRATHEDLPNDVLRMIRRQDKILGMGLFRFASAWILLHELGHLKLGHTYVEGLPSFMQEKEADRFAAEWMMDAATDSRGDKQGVDRLSAILGMAIALLWSTVFNVFLGRKDSKTHPEGYDRLFQVLDHVVDRGDEEEYPVVWYCIAVMLFIHMRSAGYDFDESDAVHMQGDPRDEVNHLIDRIVKFERKK